MLGLMISTIELIVWLCLALLALMVRIGIGTLNIAFAAVGWAIGRKREPRAVGTEQGSFGHRYGAIIGIGLFLIAGAALYVHRTGFVPFQIPGFSLLQDR